MNKYWVLLLLMMCTVAGIAQELMPFAHQAIQPGEELTYKISYGFLSIGEAKIVTSPSIYTLNNMPCYKVDITGRTTGAVSWLTKVDDKWGAYLETKSLLPVKTYRIVRENNYKRDEMTFFDFNKKSIRYQRYDYKAGKFQDPVYFEFTKTVRDLIGGYHYLRQINYNKLSPGDTLELYGFFEDDFFNFKIIYQGKEKINTQFGKIAAIKLVPVMPNNKVFDGENSISLWLSDDENHIPLKAEANMFIGKAGCDIIKYENLKTKLSIASK